MRGKTKINPEGRLEISFGYQCNGNNENQTQPGLPLQKTSSFSCLSGAAISGNATLANTNICNGVIGSEILPNWDSPNSFRKVSSSPTLSRLEMFSSSFQSSMSNLSSSPSTPSDRPKYDSYLLNSTSAPSRSEGFLNSMEVQVAGGAAGEDRVQAICSEENGWLFCAIYDGFNGRDAADFLAGTLYETIIYYFNYLDWESGQDSVKSYCHDSDGPLQYMLEDSNISLKEKHSKMEMSSELCRHGVLDSLKRAVNQAENDFLYMVEQEMEDRPDLVSVGSCVLLVLIHGQDLYTLNLGDSRAVLATERDGNEMKANKRLKAVQLTDSHTVDNDVEKRRVLCEHTDDPKTIVGGKVKGKLKVTRALGVGYLKKEKLNDALMGILRVRDLRSPPYVSTEPSLSVHRISKSDHFVIVGSDGLFDFFSNEEAVKLVHFFISSNPCGDPAKFLLEQVVAKAARYAGFSSEVLMNVPEGRRRKYHDDVTVIVIILGTKRRTSKASTCA